MEVMEDGNLLDRVRILLQRDIAYYELHQNVLQEALCPGVVGGALDFPHHASFAAVKMVTWWEQNHISVFASPSGLIHNIRGTTAGEEDMSQTMTEEELVTTVSNTCQQLMGHLHTLTQQALDHADLQVLISTLGAAAVVANALWVYNHNREAYPKGLSFTKCVRDYQSMCEALAERLLDLHCRLISLYVLQDADSLHWEDGQQFFESERGSFVVQMWWLYMNGTKDDLWNTVPPKTAQRIFAGMLNESLTILSVRYSRAVASRARQPFIVNDIWNLLSCVAQLLPAICNSAKEMAGEKSESQSVSHIHDKCHLLFGCLVFKGAPLSKLYKKFFKGISNAECFEPIPDGWIAPWFCSVSDDIDFHLKSVSDLGDKKAIALELSILNAQPSPSWGLLLKVLMMRQCWVATAMLEHLFDNPCSIGTTEKNECAGFMCNGECYLPSTDVEQALVHIIVAIGNAAEVKATLLGALESRDTLWAAHLDRNQVWNQKLPGWLEALVEPLAECLNPVVEIIERATKEGASVEQQTALSIALLCRTTDCLPPGICQCSNLLEDIIPADCHPLADSVLIQLLVTALYRRTKDTPMAESLCHLDVSLLQELVAKVRNSHDLPGTRYDLESSPVICELQVSQLLLTEIGRRALKTIYKYLKEDSTWLLKALGQPVPHRNSSTLLYTMFHIGHKQFDEVLSENRVLDWQSLLSIPLGLKEHETWELINSRLPDSVDEEVSQHDNAVAMTLRRVFQNVATK